MHSAIYEISLSKPFRLFPKPRALDSGVSAFSSASSLQKTLSALAKAGMETDGLGVALFIPRLQMQQHH